MGWLAEMGRRRRRAWFLGAIFLLLSLVVCLGSYLGWFGWFLWGRKPAERPPVVARGAEANAFARRLMETEARYVREDVAKLRSILEKLNLAKESRYKKYAEDARFRRKKTPGSLENLGKPKSPDDLAAEKLATTANLENLDIVELYELGVRLDHMLHGTYRRFRSCELARLQDLSLEKAFEVTDVVTPEHPPVNREVFETPIPSTNSPQMAQLRKELTSIRSEVKGMVSAGTRMLDLAAILEPELLGFGSEFAMRGEDMTLWGTHLLVERPPSSFEGQTGTTPNAFEHEWGRGDGPITKKSMNLPVNLGVDLSKTMPLPGRKLLKEGRTGEWMFINSWYIIGPFPNPGRKNLEEKFPPEASIDPTLGFVGIDLDARYVGMEQKPIRWEFMATDRRVCYVPHPPKEWAIWYAYTEIWCDEDQERYVIFGSDDYGKCWINGEEVFTSGVTPHPWVPDRDHAKVQFKKGYNVVLFKLENAWGRTGWSLCVYTGDVADESEGG